MRVRVLAAALLPLTVTAGLVGGIEAQDGDAGRRTFETRCGRCHAADGTGTEMGPAIVQRLKTRTDAQLAALIHDGIPPRGMPPNLLSDADAAALIAFLRSIQRDADPEAPPRVFHTVDGTTIEGVVLGEGVDDLQVRTAEGRVRLLRKSADRIREVTSDTPWPTYNGDPRGNRYTTLAEIDKTTVSRLTPKWTFTLPDTGSLQVTPVVLDGIMYVTAVNEVYALDAGSGRQIWHFRRPRTAGAAAWANRGVAVAGDRLFVVSDAAHVLALNRWTGTQLWDTPLADWRENYFASSAPLAAGSLLITGVGGGEQGANGFVTALDQATGKEVWRFWTVPRQGEPGSDTWKGSGPPDHRGAPTWFTGSYDPELDLVYWPVGNPSQEYNGDDRQGDNLYANCILALERATGALRWYYQFTPHDLWDWDATQTSVLVDTAWQGRPRRLMLHANRNGFFYVFDRTNGTLLRATAFVRNLTWARGIGADGKPIRLPNQDPTPAGTKVCPSQDGATNWFSPSYSPATGLFYLQTFEKCSIYTKSDGAVWETGKPYLGGSQKTAADPVPQRVLKAIDVQTGAISWEMPQTGPATTWGGTLATASGLVFTGDDSGSFVAVDAATGRRLWSFAANAGWKASPMTYAFDGHQYVAVAASSSIIAFGLPPTTAPER
ncbi:MAG TPA: PQQ-binding-like beta-propeller repeat protein [Vicinamibacterales bacterium]|jgi:alcohol dehydrogenase (cytochrome c)